MRTFDWTVTDEHLAEWAETLPRQHERGVMYFSLQWALELVTALIAARADLHELRMRVEEADALARKDEDADGWITGYHFNTGAWHRLLAEVRK
ncbi:MAG: hypothetical protein LC793_23655 [Thermomicrobia bacterium]|nr:hypothetical protein [Thermomicrobia bacterium]